MDRDEVRAALLRFVWIESTSPPSYIDEDVANSVNQAFQTIWLAPLDYYRRKSTTLATVASTASYTLTPANVQEILTPVKIGAKHLRPIRTRSAFDHYPTRYQGQTSDTVDEGQPVAFYVERTNNAGTADLSAVSILFTPTPDAIYTVTYDYVPEAPSYTVSQMSDASALEFPHEYVESLFLPIARFHMTNSHFFHNDKDRDREAFAIREYQSAMQKLGYADPQVSQATEGRKETSE